MSDDAVVGASTPQAEVVASGGVSRLAKGDWVLYYDAADGGRPPRAQHPESAPVARLARVMHVVRPRNPRSSLWLVVCTPGTAPEVRTDVRFAPTPRVNHWTWLEAN